MPWLAMGQCNKKCYICFTINRYTTIDMIKKYTRSFVPAQFCVTDWDTLAPFYDQLLERPLTSLDQLKTFLRDWSELEGVVQEDAGWRYIHASCDAQDQKAKQRYAYFITDIAPKITPITHQLHQKVCQAEGTVALRKTSAFDIFCKKIEHDLRCYSEKNIPIQTEIQLYAKKYNEHIAAMTVNIDGQEQTLQQASVHLESTDRALRQRVYEKIQQRRLKDQDSIDRIYTNLIQNRHNLAQNAGFDHFSDYAFVSMHRFDYTAADCFTFHQAIQAEVMPLMHQMAAQRKQALGVSSLRPFDLAVDLHGRAPLQPFATEEELLTKSMQLFARLDPFLADCLDTMKKMGHLDLMSRKHKAPGGYNLSLIHI